MLELLCTHLEKVASKSDKNMMTVGNLGVCFGPTLLRDEEETVAAIIDIKFANVIVEILIENWWQIFRSNAHHCIVQPAQWLNPLCINNQLAEIEKVFQQRWQSTAQGCR